ncbi:hypothetical protein QFC19_006758 [Naganishia cerealis]|uniref:Uncharacterized protein n=1 Tax=Naganishia cerealis TaxID=610337 RepID=A0ACC2VF84_9TREE|nr:hypothetical protein QFC19_006758 [Naganishia cerealis]
MNICRVSDGAYERNKLDIAAYDTLPDLLHAVASILDIPTHNLILFLADGRQLDAQQFHALWEKSGEWGKQRTDDDDDDDGEQGGIYAFDRDAFGAEPDEFVRGLEEDVVLEGELPSLRAMNPHELEVADMTMRDKPTPECRASGVFRARLDAFVCPYDGRTSLPFPRLSARETDPFGPLDAREPVCCSYSARYAGHGRVFGVSLEDAHLSTQTLSPFLSSLHQTHALGARLSVQLRGLRIAGGNLAEHLGKLVDGSSDVEDEGDERKPLPARNSNDATATTSADTDAAVHAQNPSPKAGWRTFQHLIETELSRELSLIGPYPVPSGYRPLPSQQQQQQPWGMEQDMHVISSIEVHESFRRPSSVATAGSGKSKDPGGAAAQMTRITSNSSTAPSPVTVNAGDSRAASTREEKRKTLADYVNFGRMKVVRDNCRRIYDDHQQQYAAITADLFTLQSSTEQILRSIDGLETQVEPEMRFLLAEAEAVMDEARLLVVEDPVISMTHLKNDFCLQLHIHLHSIAHQQSTIAHIGVAMSALEDALLATRTGIISPTGKTSGFTHLDRLRNMLSAYLTTIVEILWRKQLAEVLEAKSSSLTESLAGFLTMERKRRRLFEQAELTLLPPDINVFTRHASATGGTSAPAEGGTPDFEFSVRAGFEELADRHITRTDLEGEWVSFGLSSPGGLLIAALVLVSTVEALKQDPALVPYFTRSQDSVLDRAVTRLKNLMDDMDLSILQLETLWVDKRTSLARTVRLDTSLSMLFLAATPSFASDEQGESAAVELARLTEEYAAMQLSHEQLREQVQQMEPRSSDISTDGGLAKENESLQQQVAQLQVELNHRQSIHEQDLARMQQLEADRSQILRGLSDARNDEENVAARLVGLQAELDNVLSALNDTRAERDELAKDQAGHIESAVEARLVELQGDRTQLQEQSAALLVQLEQVKSTHHSQVEHLQNRHAREVDGLKAELGMAKAQVKESQKAKVDLLQELSVIRANLAAVKEELGSAGRFSLAAMKLASKYHDCVARLHAAIQSSATISGSTSALLKPRDSMGEVSTRDTDGQSLLQQELDVLQDYDLDAFTDAVNRTMSLVKKWQKSCRSYRDRAKDKIAFSNFSKGDLALFLPTRNATAKSWAAFNISSPHHFLVVESDSTLEEQVKNREWIVARITKIDEDVVETTQRPDSNPYGLAEGIRYYSLSVEPYTPSTGKLRRSDSGNKMPAMSTPGAPLTSRTLTSGQNTDYFGSMALNRRATIPESTPQPRDHESRALAQPRRPSSVASSQGSTFSKKGKGFQYGNATKASSTLAVSSMATTGLDHQSPTPADTQRGQRRSLTNTLPASTDDRVRVTEIPTAAATGPVQKPTLHPQLRPGSLSRRVASNADADNAAGMGQGALDILKRIESERSAKK